MHPTKVYLNVATDSSGEPRGFHKAGSTFFFDEAEANARREAQLMPSAFATVPCILMTEEEYGQLDEGIELMSNQLAAGAKQIAQLTDQLRALHEQMNGTVAA